MKKIISTISISLVVLALATSPFYIKVKTECRSQYGECPAEITSKFDINKLSLISAKNKARKVLTANPLVVNYRTQFRLPGILLIDVVIKKPAFAIRGLNEGIVGLVDRDGMILSVVPDTGLPTISGSQEEIKIGKKVTDQNLFALKLIQGIYEMFQVGSGTFQDGSLVVELPTQIRVLLPVSGDRDLILGTLRLVYSKIVSEEGGDNKYSEIDLRFKNPVIR